MIEIDVTFTLLIFKLEYNSKEEQFWQFFTSIFLLPEINFNLNIRLTSNVNNIELDSF